MESTCRSCYADSTVERLLYRSNPQATTRCCRGSWPSRLTPATALVPAKPRGAWVLLLLLPRNTSLQRKVEAACAATTVPTVCGSTQTSSKLLRIRIRERMMQ